jgi:hypothetical protein
MVAVPVGTSAGGLVNFSLNWITGSIAGHPIEAMLKKDGLTTTAYSYGTVGTNAFNSGQAFTGWSISAIVGAIQAGNQLSIHYYRNDGGNVEDGSVSLLYCPTC